MQDIKDRPNIEEQYISAGSSSNLRVEADRRGDADILIASGWSASRIGSALMRLHTEFDSTSRNHGNVSETDFRLLIGKLKSLGAVREQVEFQAVKWGMEQPDRLALAVIGWWLDKVCHKCHGRKFEQINGTPALSGRVCKTCRGTGESHLPHGEAGRRLTVFMDDCVSRAQQSIKNRLHSIQN